MDLTHYFDTRSGSKSLLNLWLFWLIVIVILKFNVLTAPPVWDTVMGVFSPAIYLYENNFDILALLQEDNWWRGGPNVHSLSLVTWIIALVMTLTGNPVLTFIVLHSLAFILMAYGMLVYVRLVRGFGFGFYSAIASGVFILIFPLVLVQVGYMYTELPVMVCSILAVDLWRRNRIGYAITACGLALFIKLTAIALAICMILAALTQIRTSTKKYLLVILILAGVTLLAVKLPSILGRPDFVNTGWGSSSLLLHQLKARMVAVPDLAWLMIISMVCSLALILKTLENIKNHDSREKSCNTYQSQLICLLLPVVFGVVVVAVAFNQSLLLPRYLVPVVPFSLITILLFLKWIRLKRFLLVGLLPVSLYFLANYNGKFYPVNIDSFSVVERSHAYQKFNQVKMLSIEALKMKPTGIPAYVTKEIHYMISHPMMGYTDAPIPETFPIFIEPYNMLPLHNFPGRFYLLKASSIHGGRTIDKLVNHAHSDPNYEVFRQEFSESHFESTLIEVVRKSE